jgi:hypothetical protein
MDAIGIYISHVNRTKSEEKEMLYAAEKIVELERTVELGKQAEKELEKVRDRMMELALEYASLKEDA